MTSYRIGRGADNDIVIDESSISRAHAELVVLPDGQYLLRDLGSSNGTMVSQDGGWATIDEATIEAETPIRLGQKFVTASGLIALAGGRALPDVEASPRQSDETRVTPEQRIAPAGKAKGTMPSWVIPAAAIGGGALLIIAVAVILLVGPLGGASRGDFVGACSLHLGSRSKCECWGKALGNRFSSQDFNAFTAAIRKPDWQTALPPALREKFTGVRREIEAKCGPLG